MNLRLEVRPVAGGMTYAAWLVNTDTGAEAFLYAEANRLSGPNKHKAHDNVTHRASEVARVIGPDCAVLS